MAQLCHEPRAVVFPATAALLLTVSLADDMSGGISK
jgi:hypothetical protein